MSDSDTIYSGYFNDEGDPIPIDRLIYYTKEGIQLYVEPTSTIRPVQISSIVPSQISVISQQPNASFDVPHCWWPNCNKSTDMKIEDPPYRLICEICGCSLRQHPFFGEGKEYDIGNNQCIDAWKALTKLEQAQVYRKHGFPTPKRGSLKKKR